MPTAFESGFPMGICKRFIYSCMPTPTALLDLAILPPYFLADQYHGRTHTYICNNLNSKLCCRPSCSTSLRGKIKGKKFVPGKEENGRSGERSGEVLIRRSGMWVGEESKRRPTQLFKDAVLLVSRLDGTIELHLYIEIRPTSSMH